MLHALIICTSSLEVNLLTQVHLQFLLLTLNAKTVPCMLDHWREKKLSRPVKKTRKGVLAGNKALNHSNGSQCQC